jgi:hypothetical protein
MTSIATNFGLACSAKDGERKVILNNVMSDLREVSNYYPEYKKRAA